MTSTGTGLGLTITKELIELMGGTIIVQSEVNKGTVFTVNMDIEYDELNKAERDSQDIRPFPGKRALVVDDNKINRDIAQLQLESLDISVECAKNGKEAVDMFECSKEFYYDIIFMDIMMPIMDGLTASRCIRALNRKDASSIPMVAITANAFMDDVHKSLSNGMNFHLSKPFDREQLSIVLAESFKTTNNFDKKDF